jgi:hypothetical protein
MKLAVVDVFVDEQVKAANAQVQALREARARVVADRKLAELWRLRREGWSLQDALEEVERRASRLPANDAGTPHE